MPPKSRKRNDDDSSQYPYKGNVNPTSTTLIVRIRDGEPVAWSRFAELYTPLIRRWCRKPGGILTQQEQWEVIDLFVNAEMTSTEVAEAMNMKPDAVRKIKSRVLKRIREEYATLGIDDDLPNKIG